MLRACVAGAALAGANAHFTRSVPTLQESDPKAKVFRCHADNTKVDEKRFPRYAAGKN